jgi:hypothetical protein
MNRLGARRQYNVFEAISARLLQPTRQCVEENQGPNVVSAGSSVPRRIGETTTSLLSLSWGTSRGKNTHFVRIKQT